MATLALFDFDHTLYKKDSLLEFTKFHCQNQYYWGLLKLMPFLVGLKLGVLNNEKVKLKYFKHFFEGIDYAAFCVSATNFAKEKIDSNINQLICAKFLQHIHAGDQIYIVTASAAEWIQPWSEQFGVNVIGTAIEIENGKLTGGFSTPNCYGQQKVDRIIESVDLDYFDKIYVYGYGKGDREMLRIQKSV